ncbi:chemotaxis protein CheB [Polyangium aurulentum]|uniref:chemotaxis protein CheB n=1 Tax=Polyangium aurulentum TaxID=2567896 RepID=UPI00146F451D|nr:chemotaxis protein CheB [Polyangium aurulentum]UQA55405.1 chemotaxis protein CheB [Polyangium aurulentum]
MVAIACSSGGLRAMRGILSALPREYPVPIIISQHRGDTQESYLPALLGGWTPLAVHDAQHGERLTPGTVHLCPAGRHIQVTPAGTLRITDGPRINFVKPSADLLFQSVADVFGERSAAVILTGNGWDGSMGARAIRGAGGVVIAQDEATSDYPDMPRAAVDLGKADLVLPLERIPFALMCLALGTEAAAAAMPPSGAKPGLNL